MDKPRTRAWRLAGELLAMAALGALQTLAFVHTQAWPVQWLCIAALAWRVLRSTPGHAAALGLAFGTAWLGAGVWWLFISMHRYGGLPAALAAAAVALLALALAGYLALAMAAAARARRGRPWADAALFALAWLAAELARGLLFTGFPWVASGYGQVDGPLAGWAPWVGVYGIGALQAAVAALLVAPAGMPAQPGRARAIGGALGAIALLVLPASFGAPAFTAPVGTLRVTLLQPNVAQDEKFVVERLPATLDWLAAALRAADGDLVVTPETAIPLLPSQLAEFDPAYWPGLRLRFAQPGAPAALVGVPLGDFQTGYTNSVLGLGPGSGNYRYDKAHLVPLGEFVPAGFRWLVEMMNIPLGDFDRGPYDAASFGVGRERIAPNICYEDLFGEELARRFADEARAPTILANVSNIGWFGDTIAVEQHLNISRMRSLELQRPMLRATNTGATAVIDHRGRVQARLAPFTRGTLAANVQGRQGRTPYAAWVAVIGLWPALLASWLLLALACWRPGAGARVGAEPGGGR